MKFLTRVWNWLTSPFIVRSNAGTPFNVVRDQPQVADNVYAGLDARSMEEIRAVRQAKEAQAKKTGYGVRSVDYSWLPASASERRPATDPDPVDVLNPLNILSPLNPLNPVYQFESASASSVPDSVDSTPSVDSHVQSVEPATHDSPAPAEQPATDVPAPDTNTGAYDTGSPFSYDNSSSISHASSPDFSYDNSSSTSSDNGSSSYDSGGSSSYDSGGSSSYDSGSSSFDSGSSSSFDSGSGY